MSRPKLSNNKKLGKVLEEEVWFQLIIMYAVFATWKSYLCSRTILRLRKMTAPPVLFEGGMDVHAFERLKRATKSETYDKLLEQFVGIGIKVFQMTTDYFPYVWRLTADFSKSSTYRAVWFSVIDRVMYESAFIPVIFFSAIYQKRDPFLAVLNGMYDTLYSAGITGLWAYVVVYMFELVHPSGIVILVVLYDFTGMVLLALFIKFLENHILRPLPRNEIGSKIESMATIVGYPINRIYVDDMSPEPETIYYTSLWFNMITVTPRLLSVLDPDQVASIVAHEIGKWFYVHNLYHHVFHYTCVLVKCYVLIVTYGNEKICHIFRVDSKAHPIIPHLLAFYFIWEPIYDFVNGIYGIFKAYGYFIRDRYSCRVWSSKSLREALIKLSYWNLIYYPLFDGWHSAWFYGCPSTIQRISRILRTDQRE